MKQFLSFYFLLLSISCMAQTFPKKYVDSLTAVALSKKSTHPMVLNRDSVLQLLWKAPEPVDRIAMFYDIVAYSDELTPKKTLYYHQLILEGAQKKSRQSAGGFGNGRAGLYQLYERQYSQRIKDDL